MVEATGATTVVRGSMGLAGENERKPSGHRSQNGWQVGISNKR